LLRLIPPKLNHPVSPPPLPLLSPELNWIGLGLGLGSNIYYRCFYFSSGKGYVVRAAGRQAGRQAEQAGIYLNIFLFIYLFIYFLFIN